MKSIKILFSILLFALFIISIIFSYKKIERTIYPIKYSEYVTEYAEKYYLEPSLVYAVIKCESSFKQDAVSHKGALGLMQITPNTYKWLISKIDNSLTANVDDLFNEETNIKFGCYLLSLHLNEFENIDTALAAYHAGRGKVNEWLNNNEYSKDGITLETIPYNDTNSYVNKVINVQQKYQKIYKFK